MLDAVVISDLHLGSENCQAKALIQFLEDLRTGAINTRRLILNGDVFDSIDFRRLKKSHWKVLSLLRKMSDELEIIWINGNHDGPVDVVSPLLGVEVRDELILTSDDKRILLHHGHRFDRFIDDHPLITALGDFIYRVLQKVDSSHRVARNAKSRSKTFLRCLEVIEVKSIDLAKRLDCEAVCCGHTHHATANERGPVAYYNSGCWTEKPCHYLTIHEGVVRVCAYQHVDDAVLQMA